MNRRDFLAAIGVGTAAGLAGCDGQGGGTPTGAEGGSNPTPTAQSDGDGGSTPDGSGGSTEAPASSTSLSDVQVQSTDSYRFRIDMSSYEGTDTDLVTAGRYSGGNFVSRATAEGQSYESYLVDGIHYYVAGGECLELGNTNQQTNADTGEWAETEDTTSNLQEWADVTATGTTTIDGEEVYVFEVDPDGRDIEYTYTYYISVESGYLRRVETRGLVADYWDWGSAPAVEAPC